MPLTLGHRTLITGTAMELFVNIIGLLALFMPLPPDTKRAVLLTVIVITALWDLATLVYLHWAPVVMVPAAAGGAAPPPPPVHHMAREAIKAGIFSATLALLFSIVALLVLVINMGIGYWATIVIVGIFLFLATIQDIVTAIAVMRR